MYYLFGEIYSTCDILLLGVLILLPMSLLTLWILASFEEDENLVIFGSISLIMIAMVCYDTIEDSRDPQAESIARTKAYSEIVFKKTTEDMERISYLKKHIRLAKQTLYHDTLLMEKSKKRKSHYRPSMFIRNNYARHKELVEEDRNYLLRHKIELARLLLRYNGFLVGTPVFDLLKES